MFDDITVTISIINDILTVIKIISTLSGHTFYRQNQILMIHFQRSSDLKVLSFAHIKCHINVDEYLLLTLINAPNFSFVVDFKLSFGW